MDRPGFDQTKKNFFFGTEVEHTPAYGKKTLFVIGLQDVTDIHLEATKHSCDHIYFGANQSFPNISTNDQAWFQWEDMITPMLKNNFLCTLDIDITQVEGLCESGLVEFHNFIPMISAKIPYLRLLGYNATLKIDDRDFAATNPGVWCHNLHDLQDRSKFTDWSQYSNDEIIR